MFDIDCVPNALYPFGARAIVHIPKEKRESKLDERGQLCRLLAYPAAGAGWLFWSTAEHRVIHSTLAVFPDFQNLPVKTEPDKASIDFLLNQLTLHLGQERTNKIAEEGGQV